MLWIIIGSAIVALGAAASLWSSRDSRRDVSTGHPRFESVADITGIWSRESLDAILGTRDADDRYHATAEQVRNIRKPSWKLWLDSDLSDIVCLVAALAAPFIYASDTGIGIILLCLAGTNLMFGYIWAAFVVVRNGAAKELESSK